MTFPKQFAITSGNLHRFTRLKRHSF